MNINVTILLPIFSVEFQKVSLGDYLSFSEKPNLRLWYHYEWSCSQHGPDLEQNFYFRSCCTTTFSLTSLFKGVSWRREVDAWFAGTGTFHQKKSVYMSRLLHLVRGWRATEDLVLGRVVTMFYRSFRALLILSIMFVSLVQVWDCKVNTIDPAIQRDS